MDNTPNPGLGTDMKLIRAAISPDNTAALAAVDRVQELMQRVAQAMLADILGSIINQVIAERAADPADLPTTGPMQ